MRPEDLSAHRSSDLIIGMIFRMEAALDLVSNYFTRLVDAQQLKWRREQAAALAPGRLN